MLSRSGGQILGYGCHFQQGAGLGSGWKVVKSEMDVGGRELKLWLDFELGSQFACPQCGEFCPVHDTPMLSRLFTIWLQAGNGQFQLILSRKLPWLPMRSS